MPVVPLIFEPIFRPKLWGGRRLETVLGKQLPANQAIGESWECADLDNGQSVVAQGPARGKTLHELTGEWGADLLGRVALIEGRFPLLIKFLDATEPLSVQVHPDAEAAKALGVAGPIKQEAWYVVHAEPNARIYRGLREGVTVESLRQCIEESPGGIAACLNSIPVKAGDRFYLPTGMVHALGGGVVVAEVQTPADVTFRLYDWGRTRPDADAGLHLEQGLASIRPSPETAAFETRSHVTSVFTTITRLVKCPSFMIEKVRFVEQIEQAIPYAEPVIWIVLDGRGEIHFKGGSQPFGRGDVVLLPAALQEGGLKTVTACTWLEVTIPVASDLAGLDRTDGGRHAGANRPDGFVPLRFQRPE